MKKLLAIAVITLAAGFIAVSQQPSSPRYHTIFQMDDGSEAAWNVLAPHVNNLRAALEKEGGVEVEVVFYGGGLNAIRKTNTKFEAAFKDLAEKGVKLVACQNAMRVMNVKSEDLFPFVSEVDSGIAELTRKQTAGWAYIK